ncbi:hypothetical protein L0Y65_05625 [Candidatus Micrarchaeota archaeon]|nr:hypothetical protein [Candidatus Micrarchaeota archaeon]
MRFHSDDLRKEARIIAAGGKNARQAWTELRQWAARRGPAAEKCAMMEFLEAYGGTPDAAFIMPEIMRNASQVFSPQELAGPARLAGRTSVAGDTRPQVPHLGPKHSLPASSSRPELSLTFRPSAREGTTPRLGAIEPVIPSADHAYLRDMPMRMRDRIESGSLRAPFAAAPGPSDMKGVRGGYSGQAHRIDMQKSPDTMQIGAHKGEHIVRSLIHSLRSHGRDDLPHMSPAPVAVRPKSKKKTNAARMAKPARKPRSACKPLARKAKARKSVSPKTRRKRSGKHIRK